MGQTKEITRISVITDTENSYEQIGDIDGGGIDHEWLKNHIKNYGHVQLLNKLAWMNYQIWLAVREVNAESDDVNGSNTEL